jgi:hypothetical protein
MRRTLALLVLALPLLVAACDITEPDLAALQPPPDVAAKAEAPAPPAVSDAD